MLNHSLKTYSWILVGSSFHYRSQRIDCRFISGIDETKIIHYELKLSLHILKVHKSCKSQFNKHLGSDVEFKIICHSMNFEVANIRFCCSLQSLCCMQCSIRAFKVYASVFSYRHSGQQKQIQFTSSKIYYAMRINIAPININYLTFRYNKH